MMLQVNFDPFPEFTTARLSIRRIVPADAERIYQLRSDKQVMQYLGRPMMASVKEAEEWVAKFDQASKQQDGINWAICLKNNPQLMGTIGYWRLLKEHYRAEIGYLLDPSLQGQGLMHEAFVPVLNYGFETMQLHSIEAHVQPENKGSTKLLEKNGFTREGYFRENFFFNGSFSDTAVYSLLAADYATFNQTIKR